MTYANSLSGPLLFDDQSAILTNTQIRRLWPLSEALAPPRDGVLASRPIVNLSFAVNYAIGGLSVGGYHIVNVSLHILSTLVLSGIIRRTLLTSKLRERFAPASEGIALACALVWMVHPLQTESVNYVTQRTELMVGLFYLLTLYCAVRAAGSSVPDRWHAAAVLSCLVGMGCKESMVTAPLVVALYDRIFIFDSMRDAWRSRRRLYAGLAVSWLEFAALLTTRTHTAIGFSNGVSTWTYLLNQADMIVQYLKLTIWPHALVLDYGLPRQLVLRDVLPHAAVVMALIVLTGAALLARPTAGFLGAWLFITLAPASSVLPIVTEVGAERRMYLPLAAVVVLTVIAVWQLLETIARRATVPVAVGALSLAVVALAHATVQRNRDYASGVALLQTSADHWPHGRVHFNLATVLKEQGRVDEAMVHLRAATADNPVAQYVLASELYDRGQFSTAIGELRAFLVRNSPSTSERVAARNLIALSLAQQGEFGPAIEEFQGALKMDPVNAGLHGNLAFLLLQQNDFEGARRHYEANLSGHAGNAFVLTNLGIALEELGQIDQANERFRQALATDPNHVEARRRLDRPPRTKR